MKKPTHSCLAKKKIAQRFGSLRAASKITGISLWRISSAVNDYLDLSENELKKLGLTRHDFRNGGRE